MSDESQGPGWWLASDGKWYPPEAQPGQPTNWQPPVGNQPGMGGVPATTDAGATISYGWRHFTANAGPMLGVVFVPIVIQSVLSLIGRNIGSLAVIIVFSVISQVISLATQIGIFNASLMVTAGEPVEIGRAFSTDRWGEWIIFALVWGLMVGIGAIFCGIGALVVIAIWGLAPYYFIDKRMSLGDALRASSQATGQVNGMRLTLGLLPLFGIVGIFACFVGIFATMPAAYIGAAYLYRIANNQPVAA